MEILSGEAFAQLLEAAPDAMVIVDAKGRIALVNAQAERLFGRPRARMLGEPVETLLPERFRGAHAGHRGGFMADPKVRPMGAGLDLWALHASGREIPVEISLSPLRTPDGMLVTAAIRDVTERRGVEESNRRLAAIVEGSLDAIVGKDLEGRITSWNPAAERIFGYAAEEVVGRPVTILVPSEEREAEAAILARVRAGEPVRDVEVVRVRKDGTRVPILLTVTPVRDAAGRIVGAASVKRDLTERRLAERTMRAQSLARPLVERIVQALLERVQSPGPVVAQIGRDLARELPGGGVADHAELFTTLGLGRLRVERVDGETYTFAGDGLLGRVERATQPTCHLALGFAEGAVAAAHGQPALGAEVRCQSQGHPECRFVVKPRKA